MKTKGCPKYCDGNGCYTKKVTAEIGGKTFHDVNEHVCKELRKTFNKLLGKKTV